MAELTTTQLLQQALAHHQAGMTAEAERLYCQVLARDPFCAEAFHLYGILLDQGAQHGAAIELLRRAVTADPQAVRFRISLGAALTGQGQFEEAAGVLRQALGLEPQHPGIYNNLGNIYRQQGRLVEAEAAFRSALLADPTFADAHFNLGLLLAAAEGGSDGEKLVAAVECFRKVTELQPQVYDAWRQLEGVLGRQGKWAAAAEVYRRAVAQNPKWEEAREDLERALVLAGEVHYPGDNSAQHAQPPPPCPTGHGTLELAGALLDVDALPEALAACRQAMAAEPGAAELYVMLGTILARCGQLDEAEAACRQALECVGGGNAAAAYRALAGVQREQGQLDAALASLRAAVAVPPKGEGATQFYSSLLYLLIFHPGFDAEQLLREHLVWAEACAAPLAKEIRPYQNDRQPGRRLRIGYVSPDFSSHVLSFIMLPLLRHHDHKEFEVVCYASVPRPDAMTQRIRACADLWRDISGVTDAQVAELIRQDRIDILVDLTLHMRSNRLLVFARKSAPVQVTYCGYPGTTGLATIDYRLTDPYLDPEPAGGGDEAIYTERSMRLPHTFWCYEPLSDEPAVNELPATTAGYVTFGSLNNFSKINPELLRLWARVLKAVPNSHLLLLAGAGSQRQRTRDLLAAEGVEAAPERVEFLGRQSQPDYLRAYHRVDIALDPVPYNGHTTSMDALWMGVPVVTLVGRTVVGRAGLSQLRNLGLPELVTRTPEQYVQIAAGLAADLELLQTLRASLRERMRRSPLMDGPGFARGVESAYRAMWRRWCGA